MFFFFFKPKSIQFNLCIFGGALFSFKVQSVLRVAITFLPRLLSKNTTMLLYVSSELHLSFQMSHFNVL